MDATAQGVDSAPTSVEEALVSAHKITADQLTLATQENVNTGKAIEQILKDRGFVTDKDVMAAKAQIIGISLVDVSAIAVSPEVLNLIPQTVAERYEVMPFELDVTTGQLSVAMADPLDLTAISFLEKKSAKKIKPFLADSDDLRRAISEKYSQGLGIEVTAALKEAPVAAKVKDAVGQAAVAKGGETIRDAPVAKITSALLDFAIKSRSSDIHVEPLEDHTRVRYRIDGILYEKLVLPASIHDSVVSRIKILSDLKIDEKRIPQDGRFNYKAEGGEVDIRVSTLPTVHGEKVVMRLLRKSGGVPTLGDLGLRGTALKNLEIAILRPHGIIVICGPTGSGKTTTLYSVLSKINSTKVNIVTLEDPVEYQIPGVNQVQINPQAGLTFATGLRAFLRQDPNIILVGEIRDNETTDLAIQAALTGHLVFSTLHTSNASGAIPRFLDLGAEPFLLASSLSAIVGQRILRKICPSCRESMTPPEILVADIKNVLGPLLPKAKDGSENVALFRGRGCVECGGSGFLGRMGIFEVLPVSDKVAKMILGRADAGGVEKEAVEAGMITMKQDGYLKALEGITTIEEVLRVAQD
ncbi:MAG: General secretory pathway protein E [Microgenomates group bacterium GW2011_GWA1_48_10]|nr:MAG: General secretory pathway protein E [Microgenomates group bacterium GW2011_GWA1_48_10]